MRYDDPSRPRHADVSEAPLHVNGYSPLPVITLIRPMLSERGVWWECSPGTEGCAERADADCPRCIRHADEVWGWLCSIHAHREGARFGYHTGFISSLDEFHRAYMEDPEATLARVFKWHGPDQREVVRRAQLATKVVAVIEEDIF